MRNFNEKLENWDDKAIYLTQRYALPFSRFAIFVIYFYFGALKVFSTSPANPLVSALLERTLPGVSLESFIVVFGVFEMVIGLVFIIPHLERLAILMLGIHLIMTAIPLFILPEMTWQSFLVPTLEGQYIIKNILIIALAIGITSHLHAFRENKQKINNV